MALEAMQDGQWGLSRQVSAQVDGVEAKRLCEALIVFVRLDTFTCVDASKGCLPKQVARLFVVVLFVVVIVAPTVKRSCN